MAVERVVVVFPGQGAQAPGMGVAWRDHEAWALVELADKVLDRPVSTLLIDAPAEDLGRTENSQLSVLLASLLAWEAAKPQVQGNVVGFAGHSLGQITALIAAGALPLEDGLRLAARRAQVTQQAADSRPGRMAALLGATPEQAAESCEGVEGCWVANDNAPGQIVLAGTPEGVEAATERARELGVRKVMALPVGGAFHTPLMESAADALAPVLAEIEIRDTAVPVVSNSDARPYSDGEGWRSRLRDHLVRPVRWRQSMETLAGLAPAWVELGPGASLAAMAKRGQPDVTVRNISVPADLVPPTKPVGSADTTNDSETN